VDELRVVPASADAPAVRKVEPKYRDPVSGATWTGRGITPKWIIDKNREDFLINKPAAPSAGQGELPVSN
jgi:DNA-binding protein H-NS